MVPLPSEKVTYDSPTALNVLIDEAAVELHSEKFRYAERTAHYIEVTWQQFLSYCHSRGLEKYLSKYKDGFLADLCSRTPALKASTIKRKDSHMKMLDMFIRNGTWEKGNLDPLQVISALRDLFIRFFGKEVEALRAFFIEGGLANAESQNHHIVRKIEP